MFEALDLIQILLQKNYHSLISYTFWVEEGLGDSLPLSLLSVQVMHLSLPKTEYCNKIEKDNAVITAAMLIKSVSPTSLQMESFFVSQTTRLQYSHIIQNDNPSPELQAC